MNIVAYIGRDDSCIYFCEFKNDNAAINQIIDNSNRNLELEEYYNEILQVNKNKSFTDTWNRYMRLLIEILEENNCNIIWD